MGRQARTEGPESGPDRSPPRASDVPTDDTDITAAGGQDDPASADSGELARGTTVGRYVVLGPLGAGAMGMVFGAYDPGLDRKVALKLLRGNSRDANGHARLLAEAQALARLSHPNVVAVHDVGEHDDRVFVAMEFVKGQTLTQWLVQRRTWSQILDVFAAAGLGLAAAHDSGLVHRDFKPDNVMIDEEGRVRVMDFGLARGTQPSVAVTDGAAAESTDANVALGTDSGIAGTPAYMAPEQHQRQRSGAVADQFSFCVALFEALYGYRPFPGRTLAELSYNVCAGNVALPDDERDVPRATQQIVLRGLSVRPDDRFGSMAALLRALAVDPVRRRRRWIAAVALTGVIGAGLGQQQLTAMNLQRTCAEAAQQLQGTWNATVAESVHASLRATGSPLADSTMEHARPWLDRSIQQWAEHREAACLAAPRDGWAAATQARSETCFDNLAAHITELVTVLQEPTAVSTLRVVPAVAAIPSGRLCADAQWLAEQPATDSAQAGALAKKLARYRGRREASRRWAGQDAQVQALVQEAEALGIPGLHASALLAAVRTASTARSFEEARERAVEALVVASGQGGSDSLAAEAASEVAFISQYGLLQDAEALRWARVAQVWFDRAGIGVDDLRRTRVYDAIGLAHVHAADHDAAEEVMLRALAIRERELGRDHPSYGATLSNLANADFIAGAYELAQQRYTDAAEAITRASGRNAPRRATTLHNLGLVHNALQRPDAAVQTLTEALRIRQLVYGEQHPRAGHTLVPLGSAFIHQHRLAEARDHLGRAVAIFRRSGNDSEGLADALAGLAAVHVAFGTDEAAVPLFKEALEVRLRVFPSHHPLVIAAQMDLAAQYGIVGRLDDATATIETAMSADDTLAADPVLRGEVLASVADIAQRRGELDQAAAAASEALPLIRAHPDDGAVLYREALNLLAGIDLERGHLDAARSAFQTAILTATEHGVSDRVLAQSRLGQARVTTAVAGHATPAAISEGRRALAVIEGIADRPAHWDDVYLEWLAEHASP